MFNIVNNIKFIKFIEKKNIICIDNIFNWFFFFNKFNGNDFFFISIVKKFFCLKIKLLKKKLLKIKLLKKKLLKIWKVTKKLNKVEFNFIKKSKNILL